MSKIKNRWYALQMFADGSGAGSSAGASAGADGGQAGSVADTGADSPAAGEAELRKLGISEAGIKKMADRAKRLGVKSLVMASTCTDAKPDGAGAADPQSKTPTQESTTTAEQTESTGEQTQGEENATPRKTLRELLKADPALKAEYDAGMQTAIKSRLQAAKGAQDNMAVLEPALMRAAQYYGMDIEAIDYKALAEKINGDDRYSEDRALENGNSISEQKRLDAAKVQAVLDRRSEQQRQIDDHAKKIANEAAEFAKKVPGFDLIQELKNPYFEQMIRPGGGATVEMAYNAIHHEELTRAAIAKAQEAAKAQVVNAVQAGTQRPSETAAQSAAPAQTTIDPRRFTPAQRKFVRDQVAIAAAQGRKLRLEDIQFN